MPDTREAHEQLVQHAQTVYEETVASLKLVGYAPTLTLEDRAAMAVWHMCQEHKNPVTILKDRNGDWRFQ